MTFSAAFPLLFAGMWLTVTTILAKLSGWFDLTRAYPDRPDQPLLRLRGQSGTMGLSVDMRGILTVSVCPSGVRVGMNRLFGPFCRDFLVPWADLTVTRTSTLFGTTARLDFGDPVIGTLRLPGRVADRLADAATGRWPESGPFILETRRDMVRRLLRDSALVYAFAALFFLVIVVALPGGPPILVAILLPAIPAILLFIAQYLRDRR